MDRIGKPNQRDQTENEIGFLMWKLESIENFFPCYQTMIKKE